MRTGLSCLLLASLIQAGLAVKFSGEKVKLGKAKCTCDFTIKPGPPCGGVAKCDKKCSGKGPVSLEGFEFNLQCKKGKCSITECQAEAPVGSGSEPEPTGSGPEPLPITGSGSGPVPLPPTGSGSGPVPLPITGSGSGPVPLPTTGSGSGPNMGEGMQCSCNCDCPDGGSNCECACNCPVKSKFLVCGSGFTKVCPMMYDTMCPDMMMAVCPGMDTPITTGMEQTRKGQNRMSQEGEREGNCQCVPDFLLAMVPGMPGPGDMVAGRSGMTRDPVKTTIQFGKTKCKCTVDCKCAKGSCAKTKISCDKKCSGTAKGVEIKGCGVMDAKAAKGKVKISKCDCGGEEPTGAGSGSGPVTLPITGSGSGPMPPPGSGSEPPTESGPKCACVGI